VPASALHHRSDLPAPIGHRRGFTLVEGVVAVSVAGLLFAAVASQLVESSKLSLRVTSTLEHSRNARELIDTLSADIRAAQIIRIHPSFADRSTEARDGENGNYLVLHFVNARGVITRTVGYYVVSLGGTNNWALYRHDSARGDSAAGSLPAGDSAGRHRVIKKAVRLPDSGRLFTSARDRGVSINGEFGTIDTRGAGRAEFIRCTLSTRS